MSLEEQTVWLSFCQECGRDVWVWTILRAPMRCLDCNPVSDIKEVVEELPCL